MRCISLWQPFASAIALGHKRFETRSWPTKHRGLLAIHAAKRPLMGDLKTLAMEERALGRLPARVPLGAIVAVCRLVDCHRTEDVEQIVPALDRRLGDFSWGRFAWELADVWVPREPIPFRGRQGLFDVPIELLDAGDFELLDKSGDASNPLIPACSVK